jgi:sugar/nucleoside kinase (ribokinase family)
VRRDYVTVGHVTVDVLADGSRRPGGTAFYSALQASRLGLRTLILTRGLAAEIEELLHPYAAELELQVEPSEQTTTLQTSGSGSTRSQRMLAWAGSIEREPALDTSILHLAPVARESPARWRGQAEFVGITPQGLVRDWSGKDARVSLRKADARALPARCDAIVISEVERASCAELLAAAASGGAVIAITAGERPTTILTSDGATLHAPAPARAQPGEDLGAGDVFAAAFFISLQEGRGPQEAAAFAAAAAALRIAGPGTDGIAGREEIESRLRATSAPPEEPA